MSANSFEAEIAAAAAQAAAAAAAAAMSAAVAAQAAAAQGGGGGDPGQGGAGLQAGLSAEQSAALGQMATLLQQQPVLNPVQAQLLANPELAAKMMGPAAALGGLAAVGDPTSSCTIYVGNLYPAITAEQLSKFFAAVCGEVRCLLRCAACG